MNIELFVPSRGRPREAHELLSSFVRTSTTDKRAELIFLVDDDDPTAVDYPPCRIGPPTGDPVGPLNRAVAASTADIVGFMGDDSRFGTVGWDHHVLDALATPGICYGPDGHDKPWPSTVFISRILTDALGWMVPPTLRRGFFDVVWVQLAQMTGTTRRTTAEFPHDNSKGDPGSSNYDPAARVQPSVISSDEWQFHIWNQLQSKRDAQKIRRVVYAL